MKNSFTLGGGQIKIESKKLDFKAGPRIEAKNDTYTPRGGDKKVRNRKVKHFQITLVIICNNGFMSLLLWGLLIL